MDTKLSAAFALLLLLSAAIEVSPKFEGNTTRVLAYQSRLQK